MSNALVNRQRAFENNFALKEEQEFKAKIVASKLFGLWAAKEMKMADVDSYSKHLIELSIRNKDYAAIIDYVYHSFKNLGLDITKHKLEAAFLGNLDECRRKLAE